MKLQHWGRGYLRKRIKEGYSGCMKVCGGGFWSGKSGGGGGG